jgi:hypothetical protein
MFHVTIVGGTLCFIACVPFLCVMLRRCPSLGYIAPNGKMLHER